MIKMNSKLFFCSVILIALMVGCKHANEKMSASGMKYIMYSENPGPKPKLGDFVTLDLVYKTENDSVLFDSHQNKLPMRFQLMDPPFTGSMEEGITLMAAGDSATFYVSADSMVRKVFSKMGGENYRRPEFLKTGSFLKFDIKLLRIQSELEAAEEMFKDQDQRKAKENNDIHRYVTDHKNFDQLDSSGIYIMKEITGKGIPVDSGKRVFINYTGKLLDGTVFASNGANGHYTFVVDRGEVIKGWDVAFQKLRQGDKATLVIPSHLAYGDEGLRNKSNGMFIIEPGTPLVFEVEVKEVR